MKEKGSTCRACVVVKRHAASPLPYESRFISSDDVFVHILHLREQNDARHMAAERAAPHSLGTAGRASVGSTSVGTAFFTTSAGLGTFGRVVGITETGKAPVAR